MFSRTPHKRRQACGQSAADPRRAAASGLALLCALGLLGGCGTSEPAKKPAPKTADDKPEAAPPPVDKGALCAARARVEDAAALGEVESLAQDLAKKANGNPNDAAKAYARILTIEKDQERWKAFKTWGDEHPESVIRDLGDCETYSAWKMADQASAPCKRAAERAPGLALVDLAQAEMSRQSGDMDAALAAIDAGIQRDASCAPLYFAKARILKEHGQLDASVAAWDEAIANAPSCASCLVAKAELVEESSGAEAALPHWEAALAARPTHPPTLQRFAAAQVGRDDKRALEAYEKAIEIETDNFAALVAAAEIAKKIEQKTKAVAYAEKAAELKPDALEVWRLLVELYQANNEPTGLEKALTEILRLLPEDPVAHAELARLARKDGAFVRALEHYEAARLAIKDPAEGAAPAPEGLGAAVDEELSALKADLIITEPGPSGGADRVVGQVQRTAQKIFEQQVRTKRGLSGTVKLRVRTDKSGKVQTVEITSDTLKDARVAASLVGNLQAARIDGGAQRLSFELSFE